MGVCVLTSSHDSSGDASPVRGLNGLAMTEVQVSAVQTLKAQCVTFTGVATGTKWDRKCILMLLVI